MMKPTNYFTAAFYVVASSGTYYGKAISKSPKAAMRLAENKAWDALCAGDKKAGICSGIAVEGWQMYRGSKMLGRADNF